MTTIEEKLQEWIVNETSFLTEKSLTGIPDLSQLSLLTEGKNKKIWSYILTHIRSKYTVLKIKRVLKLKREQNNLEKLFPKPVVDFSTLHQKITNAEDKQKFLRNSVSSVKKDIASTEQALHSIHQEIDKINQKTAILHLITLYYKEKTSMLNSLHGSLSLHLKDGVFKQSSKFLPLNIEASSKKSSKSSSNETNARVTRFLEQTESLVVKKFKISPGLLNCNLQKTAVEVFKGVLMHDLLFTLKEQSKTSYMNMLKRLSKDPSTFVKSLKGSSKRDSEKLLQELKLNHISINFSVKKVKNDICRLMSEKGSFLTSKTNPFSEDTDYQTKWLLLDKIAENLGLRESITYLEEALYDEQTKVDVLKKINAAEIIYNEDIVNIQNKFYNDFDTMCLLLNSVPSMLDFIVKHFVDIHKYASDELLLVISSVLQEFPHKLENELRFENEALWNVLRKNDAIKSMLLGFETFDQPVPEAFWNLVDVATFKNLSEVCLKVKLLKDYVSSSEKDWENDELRLPNASIKYDNIMNVLQEMGESLNKCDQIFTEALSFRGNIKTALQDWWNQGAQFIPNIVYDNKTLKMWIDIVNVADSIV